MMYPTEDQREMRKKHLEDLMVQMAAKRLKATPIEERRLQVLHERLNLEHKILQDIDRLERMVKEWNLP